MTIKLKTMIEKYPGHKVKYEPQKDCQACKGTGEHKNGYGETVLCICTCVNFPQIGGLFKDFVKKELDELKKNEAHS